jgi:CHASE2 domain-containing sensor protein
MTGRPTAPSRADFARYLCHGAVYVGLALAATLVLHQTSLLRSVERANLDAVAVLVGLADRSDRVAVVVITDQDYANIFRRRSPLDRKKVEDLVRAIDQARAAVIGVDTLTEEWPLGAAAKLEKEVRSPIVWFRNVSPTAGKPCGRRRARGQIGTAGVPACSTRSPA